MLLVLYSLPSSIASKNEKWQMANDKWPVIISLLQQLNLSDIIGTSFCSNLIMETRVQYVRDGWRSYGPPVLGAILVLVILFGGYSLWSRGRTPKVTPIA